MCKTMTEKPQLNPLLKFLLEVGPLILFFIANGRWGIFVATALFMVTIVIALAVSYSLTRHLPVMALVSGAVVVVFGGLTLALQDETFIKLKPTIIYVLFGGALLGGLIFRKPLLAVVFDQMFNLTDEGWRKLTLRWAMFFFALAVLNELVWRTQTTDVWVTFKVFAILPLTFAFAMLQYPLLKKYEAKKYEASAPDR
jgi:intracellular septation protein